MKGRTGDSKQASSRAEEIDPQLPTALEVAARMGDTDPEELASVLVRELQLPDLTARLRTLMAEDGMSPDLLGEHIRVLETWRENLDRSRASSPRVPKRDHERD